MRFQRAVLFGLCGLSCAFFGCRPDLATPEGAHLECQAQTDCPGDWVCDLRAGRCRLATAPAARCGDGTLDPGEECDCGDSDETASSDCRGPNSDTASDRCRSDCRLPRCGDGALDGVEECDDGNLTPADGCSAACLRERCGNGRLDPEEVCDDGNTLAGDHCSADCLSDESCGNGIIDTAVGEQCDDGATEDGDLCQHDCRLPRCGDGVPDYSFNEECDAGAANTDSAAAPGACRTNCRWQRCGDGVPDLPAGEVCDDGNQALGDGCTPDCRSIEYCGNSYLDFLSGEQCDDGNKMSHDGCVDCQLETPLWRQEAVAPDAAGWMTYDPLRGKVVLLDGRAFGELWAWDGSVWRPQEKVDCQGFGYQAVFDAARGHFVLVGAAESLVPKETWTRDGTSCSPREPLHTPPAQDSFEMAYDSGRGRVVLFGGVTWAAGVGSVFPADVWEWDGTDWMARSPATAPPGRKYHAMAYDPARGKIVLFGGLHDGDGTYVRFDDTWEWDGTAWLKHQPAHVPPARFRHRLAYDAARGTVVLFGGENSTQSFNDTWVWNGVDWTQLSPAAAPSARYDHQMAYDAVRGRVVLLGGYSAADATYVNDTWEWDGANWADRSAFPSPSARSASAIANDAARGKVVIFGGLSPVGSSAYPDNQTWEWNGSAWSQRAPAISPSERQGHALAYDARRRKVVLFGGRARGGVVNETWEWDGTDWTQRAPAVSPPARRGHALAYDAARGKTVLCGGYYSDASGTNVNLADTWEWDGTNWVARTDAPLPAPRLLHSMTYDSVRERIVLFGGTDGLARTSTTFEFDGIRWATIPTDGAPQARSSAGMYYDMALGKVVLFGGMRDGASMTIGLNDTWEWDGVRWSERRVRTVPARRGQPATAYDALRAQAVLFGGLDYSKPSSFFGDTWTYRMESDAPDESCAGFDSDGDGLRGCEDPDCFGSCSPMCAPGSLDCDPAWPRCGDGLCTEVESCRLCPSDCGACTVCGDLICEEGEDANSCPGDCALCGDGIRQAHEECDDSGRLAGDGCSPTCRRECGDGVRGAAEECDDGNRAPGDGCSPNCRVE